MAQAAPKQRSKGRTGQDAGPSNGGLDAPQPAPERESRLILLTERVKQQDEQIQGLKALEQTLVAEVAALREECRCLKRDRLQVTSAMQRAVDTSAAESAALRAKVAACNRLIEDQQEAYRQREGELEASARAEQTVWQAKIVSLEASLLGLHEFIERREELEAASRKAQQDNVDITKSYEEKLGEMHLRAHRLQQRVEQLEREAAEQAAATGAADGTEAEPLRLLYQNRKLAASLRKAGEEASSLKQRNKDLEAEVAAVKLELQLAAELEKKAVATSSSRANEVETVQQHVAALETELADMRAARDEARASLEGTRSQPSASKREVEVKQRQFNRQAQELRHAQQTVRDVLAERSETQAFLVSSIRAVRREVAAKKEAMASASVSEGRCRGRSTSQRRQATHSSPLTPVSQPTALSPVAPGSSTLSQISPNSSFISSNSSRSSALAAATSLSDRMTTAGGRLADISELTWEEREAVLRLLLAQINSKPLVKAAQEVFAVASPSHAELEEPLPELGSPVVALDHNLD